MGRSQFLQERAGPIDTVVAPPERTDLRLQRQRARRLLLRGHPVVGSDAAEARGAEDPGLLRKEAS
jgi:hypothetical protein